MRIERWLSTLPLKLRDLFGRRQVEQELDEEIRYHLERTIEEHVAKGLTPAAARLVARRAFGGIVQQKEDCRDTRGAWGLLWCERLGQDLRYGCRLLARSPGFTLVAVSSLGIGIGVNTAVFSFADTLLLRPLGVPRSGEVVTVGSRAGNRDVLVSSYRDYVDVRDRSQSFEGLVAFTGSAVVVAAHPESAPRPGIGMFVSSNFFRVMGVAPHLGRDFRSEEDELADPHAVAILGHDFWEQQFGADRSVLGRTVRLNGIDFRVIGVAPPGFTGLDQYIRFQFYAPLTMWPRVMTDPSGGRFDARDFRSLTIKGRLKSGVTQSRAQAELSVVAADLERAYPDTNRNRTMAVRSELQTRIAQSPAIAMLLTLLTLLAAAVLFVACVNVAGLLTSRAPMRARELGLRLALGAGRRRVIRQLITESLLIAIVGGGLGLGVGYAAVALFSQIRVPTDLPIVVAFDLDHRALIFSLAVTLVSAVLFGLAPAIRSTRADLTAVMKAPDATSLGRSRRWGRATLVCGQIAASVVLLAVATFVYRGFQQQLGSGPGFRIDHLMMMSFAPGQAGYNQAQAQQLFEQVLDRARLVPGVKSAALTRYMPMDGGPPALTIIPEGFQFPAGKESATHASSIVDEQYLDTIGVPILKGRAFRATDSADAPKVAVVNDQLADRYWPGQDPIGQRFRVDNSRGPWVEIVGVATTTKYGFAIEPPLEFVYLPYRQRPPESMFLLVQSLGDPTTLVTPLTEMMRALDPNLPIYNVRTMEEQYRLRSVVFLNIIMTTIGAMGLMGLALAIVGLYGLVWSAASRRTREIGIRMAIGASRADVVQMILRQGLGLALAGLGVGLVASFAVARGLAAAFPGGPRGDGRIDGLALPMVAAAVLTVTLVAAYIPARRASRINPLDALRND